MKLPSRNSITENILLYISLALRGSIIVAIVIGIVRMQWDILFLGPVTLIATFLPAFFEKNYRVFIPPEFEFLVTIFLYAAIFLQEFYTKFIWWDKLVHTASGILLGFVGFIILYVLYVEGKLDMRPSLLAMFSFAFALALGGLWEIFEFSVDTLAGTNLQKGLNDTMVDLIVDAAGALFTSILGYFYIKKRTLGVGIFSGMVDKFVEGNSKLFEEN